jgi:hypothetical protein
LPSLRVVAAAGECCSSGCGAGAACEWRGAAAVPGCVSAVRSGGRARGGGPAVSVLVSCAAIAAIAKATGARGVMVAAPARRTMLTAAEWAVRWRMSEARALEWLRQFERTGYAERRGACWQASAKAHALHLVDRDGVPL